MYYFGSSFSTYSNKSQLVSANRLNAKMAISMIDADMGGTEIYNPLKQAINSASISDNPKIVILLTDGAVNNSDQIIKFVKDNTNLARTFAIGIGNGISNYFIKNVGLHGLGGYDYVKDSDNLEERTKNIVYKMISPYLSNIKISWTPNRSVLNSRPNVAKLPFLVKNEPFKFFLIFDSVTFQFNTEIKFTMSFFNSFSNKIETHNFSVTKSQAKTSDRLHKLALKGIIDDNKYTKTMTDEQIINTSIKYQVLCDLTAFAVVILKNSSSSQIKQAETISKQNLIEYSSNSSNLKSASANFIRSSCFILVILGFLLVLII